MADNKDFEERIEEQRDQATQWIDMASNGADSSEIDDFVEPIPMSKEEARSARKRQKNKNKKQIKISLMKKMMLFSIGPLLVMGLFVTIYTIITLKANLKTMNTDSLNNFSRGVKGAVERDCNGYIELEGGVVYLGENKERMLDSYLDNFTDLGGIDLILYYGDTSYATTIKDASGKRVANLKLSDVTKTEVLGNKARLNFDDEVINGKKYYTSYIPLQDNTGKTVGVIVAAQERSKVDKPVNNQVISLAAIAGIILLISTLIVAITSYSIANSIRKMEESLTAIEKGYLSITVNLSALSRSDEIGTMARALNNTAKKMTDIVHDINSIIRRLIKAGTSLGSSSDQSAVTAVDISNAVEAISTGAIEQAADTEKASQSVTEMGQGIDAIVDSLSALKETTEIMLEADKRSDAIIAELVESGKQTAVALEDVTTKVNDTDKSVILIQDAVSLITNIAEETSLLSLNASIEAARAGEAGKGFAVVAIQIQKLAEESSKSADKIKNAIEVLSKDSQASVKVMGEMSRAILEQQKKLEQARNQFTKVSDGINSTINEAKTIYGLSQICADERVKVLDIIENLSTISEQNATTTETTTGAMTDLNGTINLVADSAKNLQKMAYQLEDKVSFYKL